MGREKIKIKRLEKEKERIQTFNKRKIGLFKKAYELSELTGAEVTLLVRNEQGKSFMFKSTDRPLSEIIEQAFEQINGSAIMAESESENNTDFRKDENNSDGQMILIPTEIPNLEVRERQQIEQNGQFNNEEEKHKKKLGIEIPQAPENNDHKSVFSPSVQIDEFPQQVFADINSPMNIFLTTPNAWAESATAMDIGEKPFPQP